MEKVTMVWKYTEHYKFDNIARERAIQSIGGDSDCIAKFFWDKGHDNGSEWHWLTTTGVIVITNVRTGLVCTKLIARPAQLTRYSEMGMKNELTSKTKQMRNWLVPSGLLAIARKHQLEKLNLL